METFEIKNFNNLPRLLPSTAIIGNFDGVHIAHQKLFLEAQKIGLKTLVITFCNLYKDEEVLTTVSERCHYFEKMGADYLILFDYEMIRIMFHNEFEKLLKRIKVKNIICGNNFHYGYKNEGDVIDLEHYFNVYPMGNLEIDGLMVSTTNIKKLLHEGNIDLANYFLGKPYMISGPVIHGNQIGRTLGFKTANVDYGKYTLPLDGVYEVMVLCNKMAYLGMANIGLNPTLNLQSKRRLEVHIIDFNEDIYGENISVLFLKYLRQETKYPSREALIESLIKTVDYIKEDMK